MQLIKHSKSISKHQTQQGNPLPVWERVLGSKLIIMLEQSYTDVFKENGAIKDKNLMYREIGIVPATAAKCVVALMGADYSHISIRNKMMYVYYHSQGSPSGVTLYDSFPLSCLAIAKALKGEIWDLSIYSDIVEGW